MHLFLKERALSSCLLLLKGRRSLLVMWALRSNTLFAHIYQDLHTFALRLCQLCTIGSSSRVYSSGMQIKCHCHCLSLRFHSSFCRSGWLHTPSHTSPCACLYTCPCACPCACAHCSCAPIFMSSHLFMHLSLHMSSY